MAASTLSPSGLPLLSPTAILIQLLNLRLSESSHVQKKQKNILVLLEFIV
jgi:hypothetical protein